MTYTEFIASKQLKAVNAGFDIALSELNEKAFEWQKLLVKWGIKKGSVLILRIADLEKHSSN